MRSHRHLFILTLMVFLVACQCVSPTFFTDLIEDHATAVPTLTVPAAQINKTDDSPVQSKTAVPLVAPTQTASPDNDAQTYDITETIILTNAGLGDASRIVLRVALIQTIPPYQTVESSSFSIPDFETITDEFGNRYAEIEILDVPAGESRTLEFTYQVTVSKIKNTLDICSGSNIDEYVDSEQYLESLSSEISALAETLQKGRANDCETARAIYEYIGDNFIYSQYNAGDVGALQALKAGSGDCTEFSDLFITLNRSSGIPANFIEGVTCCTGGTFVPGSIQHDWSEIYLPGNGWVPVDPTWGRFRNKRSQYFAALTPDHIIVTRGRNLDSLNGYHYYYYRYWWDEVSTEISANETWSILKVDD